jgi:hypothetical protein
VWTGRNVQIEEKGGKKKTKRGSRRNKKIRRI